MKKYRIKGFQLNYQITDKKIEAAVKKVIENGNEPTVKLVAKEAGVSISTAYNHHTGEKILEALFKK